MNNLHLEKIINKYLNKQCYKDIAYNGLQITGQKKIYNIWMGVTANLNLIKQAIYNKIDTIIVHHGLIWNNTPKNIFGIQKKKIKKILLNNINLYAWHIPLDIHPIIGNNILLAKILKINVIHYPNYKYPLLIGKIKKNIKLTNFLNKIKKIFPWNIKVYTNNIYKYHNIAICSGSGFLSEKYMIQKHSINTYLTGEINEYILSILIEYKINIILLGHHYSEIYGIKFLGKWITKYLNINTKFQNIPI